MSDGHQVGRELNALEAHIENPGQRADHQRLGQARHALEQAMPARKNRGEDLLDHLVLADDDLLQLLLHELAMLGELLQNIAERFGFGRRCGGHGVEARARGRARASYGSGLGAGNCASPSPSLTALALDG